MFIFSLSLSLSLSLYIYIYIYIVFRIKEIHVEPPFPCDYVRNGYCKCVITSTAESKCVVFFVFLNHKLHAKNED